MERKRGVTIFPPHFFFSPILRLRPLSVSVTGTEGFASGSGSFRARHLVMFLMDDNIVTVTKITLKCRLTISSVIGFSS